MAHALTGNPVAGRTLTVGISLVFWGALLWGVSQMGITLPKIMPPAPEPEVITTATLPPPISEPVRPKTDPPPKIESTEQTFVEVRPPVDIEPTTQPETTGETSLPPPVISNPTWIRKPSMDDMMGLYPYGALERGLPGRVVLDCIVAANGRIGCAVVSETPTGKGFGAAALKASRLFQIAPSMVDGRPTEGGRIRVPISFQPPRD